MNLSNAFRLGVVLFLAGALGAVVFIFNDGDDDTVDSGEVRELRSYFGELNAVTQESDTTIVDLRNQYADGNENLDHAKTYWDLYVTAYQSFIDQLQAIDPPAFVADEHEAYVASARAIQVRNRNLKVEIDAATDVSAIATIFAETDESILQESRRRTACADLGDIARQYSIEAPSITNCQRPVIITATVEPSAAP